MNYLITGGGGFIGNTLAEYLSKNKKNHIIIIDLKSKIKNIKNIKYLKGDIHDYKTFEKIKKKIDIAYHFAAQTSAQIGEEDPKVNFKTNVVGTYNFVTWALKNKPKKCYFSSSMAVYGLFCKNVTEGDFCEPVSNYGVSKLMGEMFIKQLKKKNISFTILRLFNIYGPGQDLENLKQGMISIYLAQVLKNNKIDITGSLDRTRDFLYIDDLIKILITKKLRKNETYNVGFGKPIKVRRVIELIEKNLKKKIATNVREKSEGDIFNSHANIDKLRKLNLVPKINIKKGIKKFLKEIKS